MPGPKRSLAASKRNVFRSLTALLPKAQARRAIFEYIEIYYNNQRLHSTLIITLHINTKPLGKPREKLF